MKFKVINPSSKFFNQVGNKYGQIRSQISGEMIFLLELSGETYEGFTEKELKRVFE